MKPHYGIIYSAIFSFNSKLLPSKAYESCNIVNSVSCQKAEKSPLAATLITFLHIVASSLGTYTAKPWLVVIAVRAGKL